MAGRCALHRLRSTDTYLPSITATIIRNHHIVMVTSPTPGTVKGPANHNGSEACHHGGGHAPECNKIGNFVTDPLKRASPF